MKTNGRSLYSTYFHWWNKPCVLGTFRHHQLLVVWNVPTKRWWHLEYKASTKVNSQYPQDPWDPSHNLTRQWEIPDSDPFIDDLPLAAQGFTAPRIWSRHPYRSQQARCSPNALLGHAKKGHEPCLESSHFVMGKSSRSGCEWQMFHQDVPWRILHHQRVWQCQLA